MQGIPINTLNSIYIDSKSCTNPNEGNNSYTVDLPFQITTSTTSKMSLANLSVPYSWINISAEQGNNVFWIIWNDGFTQLPSRFIYDQTRWQIQNNNHLDPIKQDDMIYMSGNFFSKYPNFQILDRSFVSRRAIIGPDGLDYASTTQLFPGGPFFYRIELKDGFYTLEDLNRELQAFMAKEGFYLINPAGQNVYYLEFVYDVPRYRVQIKASPLPRGSDNGYNGDYSGDDFGGPTRPSPPLGWSYPTFPDTKIWLAPRDGYCEKSITAPLRDGAFSAVDVCYCPSGEFCPQMLFLDTYQSNPPQKYTSQQTISGNNKFPIGWFSYFGIDRTDPNILPLSNGIVDNLYSLNTNAYWWQCNNSKTGIPLYIYDNAHTESSGYDNSLYLRMPVADPIKFCLEKSLDPRQTNFIMLPGVSQTDLSNAYSVTNFPQLNPNAGGDPYPYNNIAEQTFYPYNSGITYPLYPSVGVPTEGLAPTYFGNVTHIPGYFSYIPSFPPIIATITSIVLTCDLINNKLRASKTGKAGSNVLTTQPINVPFGQDIQGQSYFSTWMPLQSNQVREQVKFTLTDQEGNLLDIRDPDVSIEVFITDVRY